MLAELDDNYVAVAIRKIIVEHRQLTVFMLFPSLQMFCATVRVVLAYIYFILQYMRTCTNKQKTGLDVNFTSSLPIYFYFFGVCVSDFPPSVGALKLLSFPKIIKLI